MLVWPKVKECVVRDRHCNVRMRCGGHNLGADKPVSRAYYTALTPWDGAENLGGMTPCRDT